MFGRKKAAEVKTEELTEEEPEPSTANVADAYRLWNINAQSTEIPGPLVAGRAFGLHEAQLLGSVLKVNALTSLRVCSVQFDSPMRQALLDGLSSCNTLKVLYLIDINLGPEGGAKLWPALTPSSSEGCIEVLDVRSNGLGTSGLVGLRAFFMSQPSLKVLDLAGNSLGDHGLDDIIASLSPTQPPCTAVNDSSSADVLEITTAASSRNSSRPTSRDGRGNNDATTGGGQNFEGEVDASGSLARLPPNGAEASPVAASLEELRLTTNGFGEAPVLRLLNALTDARWAPKLRRLDLSANPFPARAAAYASRSALRARRQDRKNNNPVLFNEPPVKVDSLQFAADGTPKRFVEGLKLRPTNPKTAAVMHQHEVVLVLQGNFELSESEACGLAPFRADQFLASDLSHPRHLYRRAMPSSMEASPSSPNRPPDLYPLAANTTNSRTVRSPLDREPTIETVAGRPYGLNRPLPPEVASCPPLIGSLARQLGGVRPRRFRPMAMHDERAVLRDNYTNLTKAIVLPSFVHSYKAKSDLPEGL